MSSCGLGGWGGPLPGDPSNDVVLSAIGTYGGIDIAWSFPTVNPYAVSYVRVFRGLTNNSASAIQIAEVGGDRFFDKLEEVTTCFYWIQLISINGTVLALVGPESATSQLAIDEVLAQLSGRIDSGLLATVLRTKIDKVDVVDLELQQEILDRLADNAGVYSVLSGIAIDITGLSAAVVNETAIRVNQNGVLAQSISTVQASLGADIASVRVDLTADIGVVDGKVTAIGARWTAVVDVNGLVGGFGVYNDGTTIQAGFDVDTFWVGRATDKIKPFIIDSGIVYIKEAVIPILNASKIDTTGMLIRNSAGQVIFGAGATVDPSIYMQVPSTWLNVNAIAAAAADATTKANAAEAAAIGFATTGLAGKLNTGTASTLSATLSVDAVAAAGVRVGNLTWNSSGVRTGGYGVGLTPGGLVGFDPAGNPTFSLNAVTGALAIKGDISGSSGTFSGTLTAANVITTGNLAFGAAINFRVATFSGALNPSVSAYPFSGGFQTLEVGLLTYTSYGYGSRQIELDGWEGITSLAHFAGSTSGPSWTWTLQRQVNGGAWSSLLTFGSVTVSGATLLTPYIKKIFDFDVLGSPGTAVTVGYRVALVLGYGGVASMGLSLPDLGFPSLRYLAVTEFNKAT